jgi:hypothetical protein
MINDGKTHAIYFSRRLSVPDDVLQLNGRDIPFVNNVKYLGVNFDRRMTWRHHSERTVAKALRTCVMTYSLFKIGRLNTYINVTLYKTLIRSVITYTCSTWEYAAYSHFLKLQRLQNRVIRAIGNLGRCTPVGEVHLAFKIPCVYDYINILWRTQTEVILNNVNKNVLGTGHGESRHSGLNLAAVRPTTVQLTAVSE